MKMKILFLAVCQLFLAGCINSQNKTRGENDNDNYLRYLRKFDQKFSYHFPIYIYSLFSAGCKTNPEKNDIGLMLYQYEVTRHELDSVSHFYNKKHEIIARYKSSDSCLLIVNRFETIESYNNYELPAIKDSSLINRDCYEKMYPIPNFIGYEDINTNKPLKLDSTFEFFIIEAKSGKYPQYDLKPSPQMPSSWKNGFSRGTAISRKNKCIIYWAIIW